MIQFETIFEETSPVSVRELTGGHVGHGKVHGRLPDGGDGHVNDGHVGLLGPQVSNHTGPPTVLEATVAASLYQVELVLELDLFGQLLKIKFFLRVKMFP